MNLAIGKATIVYLGHEIGFGRIAPKDTNVKAIKSFARPSYRKMAMRFLGLAGYYRKFVANFAEVVAPLTNLLQKDVKFSWDEKCQKAFERVKNMLTNSPILQAPDFSTPFKLAVDASDIGIGGVLLQDDMDGIEHPVAYFSKKLNKYQRKYSTIEKETLALILSLQHFEVYVNASSGPLVIFSDHNPLKFLHKFNNKNMRLTRWSLLLQEYDLLICHIKSKDNIIADYLSRS